MSGVSVMLKPVSGLCNMNCTYCFYRDEMTKRKKTQDTVMSQETLKNVIRKTMLNAQGCINYLYQGGEPTLAGLDFFRTAVEYQKRYNHNSVHVYNALQTNGYVIGNSNSHTTTNWDAEPEEWCRFLREENFLVGLSVDGTLETHDRYRHDVQGMGTYDRTVRTAELFDQYGVEYNILTVVTKDVAEQIEAVYENYRKKGWKYQQYILCLDPVDGEGAKRSVYSITPEQYGEFLVRLFYLWHRDYQKGCQPYLREFSNYIRILRGFPPENCAMFGICSVQNIVEANGDVYPCDFYALDEYCLGNYNRDKFVQIQENQAGRDFVARSRKLPQKCRECEFYSLCRGGCFRNRVQKPGTEEYENRFCDSYKRFFKECLSDLKEMAADLHVQ